MRIRCGDTHAIVQQLCWDDNTPIDLTNATGVDLIITPWDGLGVGDTALGGHCVIDEDRRDEGYVSYQLTEDDSETTGMYTMLYKITYTGGNVMYVPTSTVQYLWIMPAV